MILESRKRDHFDPPIPHHTRFTRGFGLGNYGVAPLFLKKRSLVIGAILGNSGKTDPIDMKTTNVSAVCPISAPSSLRNEPSNK